MQSTRADLCRRPQARLLPVARIPDRPAAVRRAEQSRPAEPMRAALAELGVDLDASARRRAGRGARQWRPRPARGLLHGEHGDAWRSPPTATASATITACSARSSTTAGSRNIRRTGCRFGNPWEFERPEVAYDIGFGGSSKIARRSGRRDAPLSLAPRRDRRGGRLRHAGRRLARPAREHAAAVVGARRRSAAARRLQPRRPCRRAGRPGRAPRRSPRCSIPSDETPAGQELRLRQEYFFASASLQDLVRRHLAHLRRPPHPGRARRRSSSTTRIRRSPSPS